MAYHILAHQRNFIIEPKQHTNHDPTAPEQYNFTVDVVQDRKTHTTKNIFGKMIFWILT